MKVKFTPRAYRDRDLILQFLRERSPLGAQRVLRSLDEALQLLSEHPLSGAATNVGDVRVLLPSKYPYKLFYRLRGESIELLHIRHTARKPIAFDRR